jgi:hypothetical protein
LERAMGIEPTSEAWEACCRWLKTHKLAAFCRFSKFSNGLDAMQGDTAKAKAAYQDFLTLWKDADPDIPIFIAAKAEYAKLQYPGAR